jgi:hypothetical protein
VEVHVEVERVAEALDESHCTALGVSRRRAQGGLGPATLRGEDSADEQAHHVAAQRAIVCHAVAKLPGEREHPLPDRHLGQDAIDQVRGRVRHAAPDARWTEPASLAREGDEPIEPAARAAQPEEAELEQSTLQIGA